MSPVKSVLHCFGIVAVFGTAVAVANDMCEATGGVEGCPSEVVIEVDDETLLMQKRAGKMGVPAQILAEMALVKYQNSSLMQTDQEGIITNFIKTVVEGLCTVGLLAALCTMTAGGACVAGGVATAVKWVGSKAVDTGKGEGIDWLAKELEARWRVCDVVAKKVSEALIGSTGGNPFEFIPTVICQPIVDCTLDECTDNIYTQLSDEKQAECFPNWYKKNDGIADKTLGQEGCIGESSYDLKKCEDGQTSFCGDENGRPNAKDDQCVPGLKCAQFRNSDDTKRCCQWSTMRQGKEFCCKDEECDALDIEFVPPSFACTGLADTKSCRGLTDEELNPAKCGYKDVQLNKFECCVKGMLGDHCLIPKDMLCASAEEDGRLNQRPCAGQRVAYTIPYFVDDEPTPARIAGRQITAPYKCAAATKTKDYWKCCQTGLFASDWELYKGFVPSLEPNKLGIDFCTPDQMRQ